ncbi:FHA domain-containing protein [Jannaschia sp. R86511]|uniref:FHA domain-containing protein n=1 Tax=Jannaschia sp. R86511 TaxID=3093853 RepID=UPI0036D41C66
MSRAGTDAAYLVLPDPTGGPGRRIPLDKATTRVGRAPSNDVRLPDPDVSRHHAELRQETGGVWVTDMGSTHGTFVNESAVTQSRPLHDGDVLRLAGTALRFVAPGPTSPTAGEPTTGTRFDVQAQQAGVIHNVQRDQYNQQVYNQHVLHVMQQRDGFLQQVAATRSRARVLVWLGLGLQLAGFALFAGFVLRFLVAISDVLADGPTSQPPDVFGPDLTGPEPLGLPLFVWGFSMAGVGGALMLVGIVLHVTATARARRVDRELPLPPLPGPGGSYGPPRARRATD